MCHIFLLSTLCSLEFLVEDVFPCIIPWIFVQHTMNQDNGQNLILVDNMVVEELKKESIGHCHRAFLYVSLSTVM